jgi:CubicO group peptidase (beta-lactamase class C family)
VLQPETVRRIWQPSRVKGSTRTLGWDRPSKQGSSTGGRWPKSSVGHLGFTGTSLWIEPDRALIAVLVTNRVCPSRANNMIRRLRPALHDAIWDQWGKGPTPSRGRRGMAGVRPPPTDPPFLPEANGDPITDRSSAEDPLLPEGPTTRVKLPAGRRRSP